MVIASQTPRTILAAVPCPRPVWDTGGKDRGGGRGEHRHGKNSKKSVPQSSVHRRFKKVFNTFLPTGKNPKTNVFFPNEGIDDP